MTKAISLGALLFSVPLTSLRREFPIRCIGGQIGALAEILGLGSFPAIEHIRSLSVQMLPEGAEDFFAIPRVGTKIIYQKINPILLRAGVDVREDYLQTDQSSSAEFQTIANSQKGDIIIVPAQINWGGNGQLSSNEFPFDNLMAASVFLTHFDLWKDSKSVIAIPNFKTATGFVI